jgi:hypothetical protein
LAGYTSSDYPQIAVWVTPPTGLTSRAEVGLNCMLC